MHAVWKRGNRPRSEPTRQFLSLTINKGKPDCRANARSAGSASSRQSCPNPLLLRHMDDDVIPRIGKRSMLDEEHEEIWV